MRWTRYDTVIHITSLVKNNEKCVKDICYHSVREVGSATSYSTWSIVSFCDLQDRKGFQLPFLHCFGNVL